MTEIMKRLGPCWCVPIVAMVCLVAGPAVAVSAPSYAIVDSVALGAPDKWDYVAFDAPSHRVYVAHGDRVDVLDGRDGTLIGSVAGIAGGSHAIIVAGANTGFTDDGTAGLAVPFDATTLRASAPIKAGDDADAMVFDPATGRLYVVDGDPGTISVVDTRTSTLVQTIEVGGKLEFAVTDGNGHIYVNGAAKREMVRIDTRSGRIDARWPMPDCVTPHGLAIDVAFHRLFAGCVNERMIVMNADTGAVVTTLPIGRGSDGIVFDAKRKRIVSANGLDGTLSVIREMDADTYIPLEPIKTMVSGRTLALDPETGRVFVAAAETKSGQAPGGRPVPRPGSLRLLFLDPSP